MNTGATDDGKAADWSRRPMYCLMWWVLPVGIAVVGDHLPIGSQATILVWTTALAWMALGCFLNARRCHRRHCYFAGPILLAGALAAGLQAAGVLRLGSDSLNVTLWSTFVLLLLSWLPEIIWSKYVSE